MAHARTHALVVAGGRIGVVLEHQIVAIVVQQRLIAAAHRLQRILAVGRAATRGVVRGGVAEHLRDHLEAAIERGQEQLQLGAEEREHIGLGDADALRDALHRGAVQPAVRELVHGGRDQLLAALGGGYAGAWSAVAAPPPARWARSSGGDTLGSLRRGGVLARSCVIQLSPC